ncbi:ADR097Wp [Eremothecium gossypii ATCC 10895]|uniref:ADR097Wp n=1 Tax=Eremothecium gossypii (strain ATCC 10895 / CBS 109.51 / FGSC 9923 / NRRL Y-1056) TaxID=284811 RepID=Q75A23_EREGS|nr:ADR097Wp [Eremothecium gossypii ATCC 10895]AAS52017.1 ADR097Wp [Eremothecium gossypii ATCC 10895]
MTKPKGPPQADTSKLMPALLVALFQKPQDRQFVIALENELLRFVESPSMSYQLQPMNSYYRLLSHQVADYHGLSHVVSREQELCVVVYKEANAKADKGRGARGSQRTLLQELEPSVMYQFPPEYFAIAAMAAMNDALLHPGNNNVQAQQWARSPHAPQPSRGAAARTPRREKPKGFKLLSRPGASAAKGADRAPHTGRGRSYESRYGWHPPSSPSVEPDRPAKTPDLQEGGRVQQVSSPVPATPRRERGSEPIEDTQDDSPQPHEFETSRYALDRMDDIPPVLLGAPVAVESPGPPIAVTQSPGTGPVHSYSSKPHRRAHNYRRNHTNQQAQKPAKGSSYPGFPGFPVSRYVAYLPQNYLSQYPQGYYYLPANCMMPYSANGSPPLDYMFRPAGPPYPMPMYALPPHGAGLHMPLQPGMQGVQVSAASPPPGQSHFPGNVYYPSSSSASGTPYSRKSSTSSTLTRESHTTPSSPHLGSTRFSAESTYDRNPPADLSHSSTDCVPPS